MDSQDKKQLTAIKFLLNMLYNGVKEKDKDSIRSHLEDLNLFLQEQNLIAE